MLLMFQRFQRRRLIYLLKTARQRNKIDTSHSKREDVVHQCQLELNEFLCIDDDKTIIMADNEHLPALQERHIRWNHFNYPPGLRLMHFVPSEISKQKKFIVLGLFIVHQVVLLNSLLNFLASCTQGGLRILYSILFLFFINPVILFVFYKGLTGLCKDKSKLKLYLILQPILIVFEVFISIVGIFGFNGFVRAGNLFSDGHGFAGTLSIIVSILFLTVGLFSSFLYVRIIRERHQLTSDLA